MKSAMPTTTLMRMPMVKPAENAYNVADGDADAGDV